jgi:hypothetical protein
MAPAGEALAAALRQERPPTPLRSLRKLHEDPEASAPPEANRRPRQFEASAVPVGPDEPARNEIAQDGPRCNIG